jgi:glycosyltransferase involved in cell wall biosynthesis
LKIASDTIAIPVLNGAAYLDEVLRAVRRQHVEIPVEVLIIDSGSTDGSVEIARRHGARVIEIPRAEFSHGGTRNLAIGEAKGDAVVFLTQDATPASDEWLASMIEGFAQADDVALVFGPHIPRPGHSHVFAREMRDHFRTWGKGEEIDVHRLDRSPEALAGYRRYPYKLQFFSDVNGAVARWAWEQIPYRDVPYAEDQLLAREMIESGCAKVFHPGAAVHHSHDYSPGGFLRRYFDEFRSLREVLGHVEPFGLEHAARSVLHQTRLDREFMKEQGVEGPELRRALGRSARHHAVRALGSGLGARADRLPAPVRKALSLDGRSTFSPVEVPASPLLEEGPLPASARPRPRDYFSFVRSGFPRRPLTLEPAPGSLAEKESLTLAWVLPPWDRGSGGHMTIFRLIQMMEARGHQCSIFVFDPSGTERDAGQELRDRIKSDFIPIDAQVFNGLEYWIGADVGIATQWWTAYPMRDLPGCYEKVYLVQDFEPAFHAYSAEYIWAEETYRMGYRCVAYTRWMAAILRQDYGLEAEWFECGTDLDVYRFHDEPREPATVAVYARKETARRGVELALSGLALLKERRPDIRVVLFGSHDRPEPAFDHVDLGVVPPERLADLYRRSTIGIAFSLTTHSLVAQEMMASGLPVVELAGDNVSSALGESGEVVLQADPNPVSVADAIEALVDRPATVRAMAQRARRFVEQRPWERSGEQLEGAVRWFLAHPRNPAAHFSSESSRVAETLGGRRYDRAVRRPTGHGLSQGD